MRFRLQRQKQIKWLSLFFSMMAFYIAVNGQNPEFKVQTGQVAISHFAISQDGLFMATGTYFTGEITLWDVSSRRQLRSLDLKSSSNLSMTLNREGKVLAVASTNGLSLWDTATGREIKNIITGRQGSYVFFDSQDRLFISSTNEEKGIVIFDFKVNRIVDRLEVRGIKISISQDGEKLAVINEGNIEIWSVTANRKLITIPKPTNTVAFYAGFYTTALSPNGQLLASGDMTGAIKIFDATTGQEKQVLAQGKQVDLMKIPDAQELAKKYEELAKKINTEEFTKELSKAKTPEEMAKIYAKIYEPINSEMIKIAEENAKRPQEGRTNTASSMAFNPNSNLLATTSNVGDVTLWNLSTGKKILELKIEKESDSENLQGADSRTSFSYDGNYLVASRGKGTVEFFNIKDPQKMVEFGTKTRDDSDNVDILKNFSVYGWSGFSPQGKWFGLFAENNLFWNLFSGGNPILLPKGEIIALFSPDEKNVVTLSSDQILKVKSIDNTGTSFSLGKLQPASHLSNISSDGRYFLSAENIKRTFLEQFSNGKEFDLEKLKAVLEKNPNQFNNNFWGGTVTVWDIVQHKAVKSFKLNSDERVLLSQQGTNQSYLNPNGKSFATVTKSDVINLRSVETGQIIVSIKGFEKQNVPDNEESMVSFTRVFGAFNPTGDILAVSDGTKLKFWNSQTGLEIRTLFSLQETKEKQPPAISALVFSPDGKKVFGVGMFSAVRIWNVADGQEFTPIKISDLNSDSTTNSDEEPTFNLFGGVSISLSVDSDGKIIALNTGGFISGSEIKLIDIAGRKHLGSIYLRGSDWLVLTPEGRFDTNNLENSELLYGVFPDSPFKALSLDVFIRQYYEPDLLRRVLSGEQFKPLPSIADINRVQPKVIIKEIKSAVNATDLADVTVEIENVTDDVSISATDRTKKKRLSSGVFDVRLFRDGQMIGNSTPTEKLASFYQAAPDLIEQNKKYFAETKQLTNTPEDEAWRTANNLAEVKGVKFDGKSKYIYTFKNIKLPHDGRKAVEFTAYAFNADRVKSDNVVKTFPIPATVANKPQPKRAFVIAFGVNKYQSSSWDLQFAANDARAMREILADKLRKIGNFAEVVEIPLISDDETISGKTLQKREATKQNVQTVLDLLAGKTPDEKRLKTLTAALGAETVGKIKPANPEDAVFISFSSHGYADRNGIFYILPTDIGAGLPRTVTPELLKNSISSDELSLWLRDVDAGEMVMIVDACNAEAAVKNSEFKPAPMGSRGLGQLAYDKGMKILTATQAANVAIETGAIGHGLLTYALVGEGLGKENKADFRAADKTINLKEWLEYGEFRVPGLYDDLLNKRLKIVGKGTDVIDLSGDNPKLNSSSQTPVLFDFTKRRQELTLVRLP